MSIIDKARAALEAIARGRQDLAEIADSVKDGAVALSTSDAAALKQMLEAEKAESRAAHDKTEDVLRAIAEGSGGG